MIKIILLLFIIFNINSKCYADYIFSTLENINYKEFNIKTEDNYILKLFRISYLNNSININLKPLLVIHGIVDSSDNFLLNKDNNIIFDLLEKGYDIWLLNLRGNKYSRKNINISSNSKQFWDFSFEESAKYDISPTIDFILKTTDHKKIDILAHSQGTTIIFAFLSENLSHKMKINKFIAVAPIVYLNNLQKNIPYISILNLFLNNILKYDEILSSDCVTGSSYMKIVRIICKFAPKICSIGLSVIDRKNENYIKIDKLYEYFKFYPGGSSMKSLLHFLQLSKLDLKDRSLRKFDYGKEKNYEIYKNEIPDIYNLNNIKIPIVLINGLYDNLSDMSSVKQLVKDFPNINFKHYIYDNFGHSSIFWGKNNDQLKKDINYELKNNN